MSVVVDPPSKRMVQLLDERGHWSTRVGADEGSYLAQKGEDSLP